MSRLVTIFSTLPLLLCIIHLTQAHPLIEYDVIRGKGSTCSWAKMIEGCSKYIEDFIASQEEVEMMAQDPEKCCVYWKGHDCLKANFHSDANCTDSSFPVDFVKFLSRLEQSLLESGCDPKSCF